MAIRRGVPPGREAGQRPPAEFATLADKVVEVTGTLIFDPYAEDRESAAEYACVVNGPPMLSDIVCIEEQRA